MIIIFYLAETRYQVLHTTLIVLLINIKFWKDAQLISPFWGLPRGSGHHCADRCPHPTPSPLLPPTPSELL